MASDDFEQAESVLQLAEAELSAFLGSLLVSHNHCDPICSAKTWIDTMMLLDWPERNHAGFFRLVSILTTACITSHPASLNGQMFTKFARALLPSTELCTGLNTRAHFTVQALD